MIWLLALPLALLGVVALSGGTARAKPAKPGLRRLAAGGRDVWIWVPPTGRGPLVVYLHGHGVDVAAALPALIPKFALARVPPIVVAPQLGPKSEPGTLGNAGALRAVIADLQAELGPAIAGPVILLAHSGGYHAAAGLLDRGGVPIVGVGLLDALYGDVASFERYALGGGRLANVYGPSTAALSVPLGERLVAKLGVRASLGGGLPTLSRRAATIPSTVGHPDVPAVYAVPILNAFSA